jgi:hypothetical protein
MEEIMEGIEMSPYASNPGELDLLPNHIRGIKDERIYGDEEDIHEGFHELTHYTEEQTTPICGKGKILLVKGAEGSRKSFFTSCMLSGAFIDNIRYTLGFRLALDPDEVIIHFDTEMDKHEVKGRKQMFNSICKLDPRDDRHQVYSINDYSWRQRLEIITHVVTTCERPIAVILIDQVADLLEDYDVNDTKQVAVVIESLLAWKRASNAMIVATMHTNRGGKTTNGVLGKNLDHKVFTSFLVEYDIDDHITRITQYKARKQKIVGQLKLMQDDRGLPRFLNYKDDF